MEDINSVVISGNLTKDPELVPNSSSICRQRSRYTVARN
jgi:single-stranded DNA-binding protein